MLCPVGLCCAPFYAVSPQGDENCRFGETFVVMADGNLKIVSSSSKFVLCLKYAFLFCHCRQLITNEPVYGFERTATTLLRTPLRSHCRLYAYSPLAAGARDSRQFDAEPRVSQLARRPSFGIKYPKIRTSGGGSVYGNVGGGVFSLLGDTIIFRLKRLLLRKPCTSPLSSTTAFPPREYFVRVRVPLEGKKGKGRRYHCRASLACIPPSARALRRRW
ncbi:hypothetical protein QTP88_022826 [Uroleucon formosanum]